VIRNAVGVCIALVGLSGCGSPLLHPASTVNDSVADAGIIGEWTATAPMQLRAVITAGPADSSGCPYAATLTVHDKGEFRTALGFELMLTDIGSSRYADLFLARPDRDKLLGAYGFLAVPVHQVMKVDRDGDTLTVRPFRGDWLESQTQGVGERTFTHDRVAVGGGDVVMITARTEQLRDLLSRHSADPAAFGDPIVFHRTGK
jgi:hypothetical protein